MGLTCNVEYWHQKDLRLWAVNAGSDAILAKANANMPRRPMPWPRCSPSERDSTIPTSLYIDAGSETTGTSATYGDIGDVQTETNEQPGRNISGHQSTKG